MKILIVEDEVTSRSILENVLSSYGACNTAANGKEAIYLFESSHEQEQPYDVICLDICMPVMDGHEVIKRIRAFEKDREIPITEGVKIVMMTGSSDGSDVLSAFREGCEAYLKKPVVAQELRETLAKLGYSQ